MTRGILIFITYFIALGITFHVAEAGVTVLVEKAALNKTVPPIPVSSVSQLSKLATVTHPAEQILLTKDKEMRNCWRTTSGDLVHLIPAKDMSLMTAVESAEPVPAPNMLRSDTPYLEIENDIPKSSSRTMRTFWPFTSLFGYDYPPPMFGPMMPMPVPPPYGMGMGMGIMGPPPLMGLGFGRW